MPAKAGVSVPRSTSGSAKTEATSMRWWSVLAVVEAHFDIRAVARLAHPVLEGLVGFALADRELRLHALAVGADVLLPAPEHFDQVPAEGRAQRCRNLVHDKLVHRFLEHGHGVARAEQAKVAALGRSRVLGVEPRHVLEFRAGVESILEAIDLGLAIGF